LQKTRVLHYSAFNPSNPRRMWMKNLIKKGLAAAGYDLRKIPDTPQITTEGCIVEWDEVGTPIRFYIENRYDLIGKDIFNCRFFEREELDALDRLVDPSGTCVDVGSNIGNHTVYFAKVLGAARVIAFEPGLWAHPRLCFNVALNQLDDKVTIHKTALSDSDGTAEMRFIAADNHGTLAIMATGEGEGMTQTVPLRRGDDLLRDEPVRLLKVDAERHEMQVLRGMSETLQRHKPVVMVEVALPEEADMQSFLSGYGYQISTRRERYGDIVNLIATVP